MILWQEKASSSGTYATMKTPSSLKLHGEDLDNNSYRSIVNGNVVRPAIIGKKWQTFDMEFNYLTESELESLMTVINHYPMYVKIKSPLFGSNGFWEGEVYCSKFDVNMQQNKTITESGVNKSQSTWNSLSFTLVQSKKVSGQ